MSWPARISGQPSTCGSVASAKRWLNQSRTMGSNSARGDTWFYFSGSVPRCAGAPEGIHVDFAVQKAAAREAASIGWRLLMLVW